MIECYFRECKYHDKEEPFCTLTECKATPEESEQFAQTRTEYLKTQGYNNPDGNYV